MYLLDFGLSAKLFTVGNHGIDCDYEIIGEINYDLLKSALFNAIH